MTGRPKRLHLWHKKSLGAISFRDPFQILQTLGSVQFRNPWDAYEVPRATSVADEKGRFDEDSETEEKLTTVDEEDVDEGSVYAFPAARLCYARVSYDHSALSGTVGDSGSDYSNPSPPPRPKARVPWAAWYNKPLPIAPPPPPPTTTGDGDDAPDTPVSYAPDPDDFESDDPADWSPRHVAAPLRAPPPAGGGGGGGTNLKAGGVAMDRRVVSEGVASTFLDSSAGSALGELVEQALVDAVAGLRLEGQVEASIRPLVSIIKRSTNQAKNRRREERGIQELAAMPDEEGNTTPVGISQEIRTVEDIGALTATEALLWLKFLDEPVPRLLQDPLEDLRALRRAVFIGFHGE